MNETEKTNRLRGPDFMARHFAGRVIDIGSGGSPVTAHCEPFDVAEGDAGRIDEVREHGAYDCVHSSHCLEHMVDARDAIRRWWRLVRPGGHLIVVVPDEDLYEQGIWPSRFNGDHKWSFRLGDKQPLWSPVSLDLRAMMAELPGATVVSAECQDQHYDHALYRHAVEKEKHPQLRHHAMVSIQRMSARGILTVPVLEEMLRFVHGLGATVDQTIGPALAQIQVVARKAD